MDEKEKINDSYLTIEAKTDINRMLGNEGSGGNLKEPFIVTFTNDAATELNPFGGHIDKTIAEITAAFRAGRPVQGHLVSESLSLDTFFNVYCYWYYNDNIVFSIIVQGVINGTYMVSEINTPQTDGNQYGVSYLFTAQ